MPSTWHVSDIDVRMHYSENDSQKIKLKFYVFPYHLSGICPASDTKLSHDYKEELRKVTRLTIAREHVLCMARIVFPPSHVCPGLDLSRPMIPLVEGYGYESLRWPACTPFYHPRIPCSDN